MVSALGPGQTPWDRPDVVCRAFNGRLGAMIDLIRKQNVFGQVKGLTFNREYQMRGEL